MIRQIFKKKLRAQNKILLLSHQNREWWRISSVKITIMDQLMEDKLLNGIDWSTQLKYLVFFIF